MGVNMVLFKERLKDARLKEPVLLYIIGTLGLKPVKYDRTERSFRLTPPKDIRHLVEIKAFMGDYLEPPTVTLRIKYLLHPDLLQTLGLPFWQEFHSYRITADQNLGLSRYDAERQGEKIIAEFFARCFRRARELKRGVDEMRMESKLEDPFQWVSDD